MAPFELGGRAGAAETWTPGVVEIRDEAGVDNGHGQATMQAVSDYVGDDPVRARA